MGFHGSSGSYGANLARLVAQAAELEIEVPQGARLHQIQALIDRHRSAQTAKELGVKIKDSDTAEDIEGKIQDGLQAILRKRKLKPGAWVDYPGTGRRQVGEFHPDTGIIILTTGKKTTPHLAVDVALRATVVDGPG